MPDWLRSLARYLFQSPGPAFNYYVPVLVASLAVLCIPIYHFALASRVRFRRYPVHLFILDGLSWWLSGIGLSWLIVIMFRSFDLPILSWRIWLYVVAVGSAFFYLRGLIWIYRRGPRLLADYETELQRKRYLAGATPAVPSVTRRTRAAKQR